MKLGKLISIVASPYISEDLISKERVGKIEELANHFPSELSSWFGFEIKLNDSVPSADFLFSVRKEYSEREVLSNREYSYPTLKDMPVWKQLNNFVSQWNNPQSILYDCANNIWFEFDMDEVNVNAPIPSFFFGTQNIKRKDDLIELSREGFSSILDNGLNHKIWTSLLSTIALLPKEADLFQIGVMLSRKTDAIRICINNLNINQIGAFLNIMKWYGDVDELKNLLKYIGSFVDEFSLDIDLSETLLPKIGLECYINKGDRAEKCNQLFDMLLTSGLCLAKKKDAIYNLSGLSHRFSEPDWPSHLINDMKKQKNQQLSAFMRYQNHIKISIEPDVGLSAKSYMGIQHTWIKVKDLIHHNNLITQK